MTQAHDILEQAGRDHADRRRATSVLPQLRLVHINTPDPECFDSEEAIEHRIGELDIGHAGWCRRESWAGRTPCVSFADCGPPLDGEWVSQDGSTSLRLMFFGGKWRLFTMVEGSTGEVALREDIALLDHGGSCFWYAIYWAGRADDPAGMRRAGYRLTGLGRTEAPK